MIKNFLKPIYKEFEKNYKTIKDTYDILNTSQDLKITIHSAGEWILDNMYIIEQEYFTIKESFGAIKCPKLPSAKTALDRYTPRILYIANQIVENHKGSVDKYIVANFINDFQKTTYITYKEFELFPFMLKLAFMKFIARICTHIYYSQLQKMKVEKVINKTIEANNALEKYADRIKTDLLDINSIKTTNTAYVEYMSYRLKMLGKQGDEYYNKLRIEVDKAGFSIEEAIEKQHSEIAKTRFYIGSAIVSLKNTSTTNWNKVFEEINKIDEILKTDYTHEYSKMDYKTKDMYRNTVIKLAKKLKLSEMYIAKKAIECSVENKKHVGFFLIGEEMELLNKKLGCYDSGREFDKKVWQKSKSELYIFTIVLFSAILAIIARVLLVPESLNIAIKIIFDICFLAVSFEVITKIVDYVLQKTIDPKILPRISYETREVEAENSTLITMPTIISSKDKIDEMVEKMEITYISNKTKNLYIMLLGDCTSEQTKETKIDQELFEYGKQKIEKLNKKYSENEDIFNLIYRKRTYNKSEDCYMGWERKRGAITHLNKLLLGKLTNEEIDNCMFIVNKNVKNIKYVITIDEDTVLPLNSAKELIGIMAHPINKPIFSKNGKIVEKGYAIVQPYVGLDIEAANKTIFSRLFGGFGGIDIYTNAVSNVYQDCFGEAIFTGKGIYDLACFETLLEGKIKENTVLSHDLLEGSYLRTGLASDIEVQDGFPHNFIAYTMRNHRWIRGDFQIISWLKTKSPLNILSQWKIFDNLRRATIDIFILVYLLIASFSPEVSFIGALVVTFIIKNFGSLIATIDALTLGKNKYIKQKQYIPIIYGFKANIMTMIFNYITIPYTSYVSLDAIIRTAYRMLISKKHKLEWTTGAAIDNMVKASLGFTYKKMFINIIVSAFLLVSGIFLNVTDIIPIAILAGLFAFGPYIAYVFSKTTKIFLTNEEVTRKDKELLLDIAKRTWKFFDSLMIEAYNFLPSDNYQDNRMPKIVPRTSSTNIGFGLLSIVNAYDLKFITIEECLNKLCKTILTIEKLSKWNGHLYNWYDIKTLEPLLPKFVSTVDSGNFVSVLFVIKQFLISTISIDDVKDKANYLVNIVDSLINETNFTKLYNSEANLFTVGYDAENEKYIESNYDILVSEARQTSLVAIALSQVSPKHWFVMNRNLVTMDRYKGLSSWSGTTFEYFMPLLFIKSYKYTLLDEALFFAAYSQKKYATMHGVPFGISESSYAKQDVDLNYQYKAFGVPWLGVKRGLNDDLVISPYSTFLMLSTIPKDAMKNIYKLIDLKAYSTFGFYESIDFTKKHIDENSRYGLVKTYMAHHQGMALTAINNYLNSNIIQERFHDNVEIKSTEILLKERTPIKIAIKEKTTDKENKFKQKEIKRYTTHVDFTRNINLEKPVINLLTNGKLSTTVLDNGASYIKYKDKCVNKGRYTDMKVSGNFLMFKDLNKDISYSTSVLPIQKKPDDFFVDYTLDTATYYRVDGDIETTTTVSIASETDIEIRKVLINNRNENEAKDILITSYMELAMTDYMSNVVHPAFNNLHIETFYDEDLDTLVAKKRLKTDTDEKMYVYAKFIGLDENIRYETEKSKIGTPEAYDSNIANYPLWPVLSLNTKITLKPGEKKKFYYIVGVANNRYDISHAVTAFSHSYLDNITKLAGEKAQVISRYLRLHEGEAGQYNRIISQALFTNKTLKSSEYWDVSLSQSMLWKFSISGDLPIVLIKTDALEDAIIIKDVIKFMDYAKQKKVDIDVIFLVNEELTKGEPISNYLIDMQRNVSYMSYTRGRIYTINVNRLEEEEKKLFNLAANVIIDSKYASFEGIKKILSSN